MPPARPHQVKKKKKKKGKSGTQDEEDSRQSDLRRVQPRPQSDNRAPDERLSRPSRSRNPDNRPSPSSRSSLSHQVDTTIPLQSSSAPQPPTGTKLEKLNNEAEKARIAARKADADCRRGRITSSQRDVANARWLSSVMASSDETTIHAEKLFGDPSKLPDPPALRSSIGRVLQNNSSSSSIASQSEEPFVSTKLRSIEVHELEEKDASERGPDMVIFTGGETTIAMRPAGKSSRPPSAKDSPSKKSSTSDSASSSSRPASLSEETVADVWAAVRRSGQASTHKAVSAPPSSITTNIPSEGCMTPYGREANHNKGRSRTPLSHSYKPNKRARGGRVLWRGDPEYEYDEFFEEDVLSWLERARNKEYEVLMLRECQGCTFGYGQRFRAENGDWITVLDAEDARKPENAKYKTKHITYYGDNIEQIGTKGCMTCLGVYFAITDNRVFCAHFNVWYNHDRDWRNPPNPVTLKDDRGLYDEIRLATIKKISNHAKEYGWQSRDVLKDTIKFVSPFREHVAHIVARAILDFLIIDEKEFYENNGIVHAQGFIITPGSDQYEVPRGKLFELKKYQEEWYSRNPARYRFADMPAIYKAYRFVDGKGLPSGDWFYTAGERNNYQWIFNPHIEVEWTRGKMAYIDHDYVKWLDQRGFAMAAEELAHEQAVSGQE